MKHSPVALLVAGVPVEMTIDAFGGSP